MKRQKQPSERTESVEESLIELAHETIERARKTYDEATVRAAVSAAECARKFEIARAKQQTEYTPEAVLSWAREKLTPAARAELVRNLQGLDRPRSGLS